MRKKFFKDINIVPHVDSVKEVMALLIYFPQYYENQNENAIGKNME